MAMWKNNSFPPLNSGNAWPVLAAGDKASGSETTEIRDGDPLHLHNSDHPGVTLVTTPLSGNNYLSWSRSMLLALRAKNKLGFINGKIPEPEIDSSQYENWKKVDCMVISWILNSISREIVDAFMYTDSAKELWDEIAERFGESNGPLIYQLEKEISNACQGNSSVTMYYTKLKKLWDELCCLSPLPTCNCGASKALTERETRQRLMQFLMGLNESYDHIRSQILIMDPLPNINKAYSMVVRFEKQRNIQSGYSDPMENAAMMSKISNYGKDNYNKAGNMGQLGTKNKGNTRKTKEEKAKLTCEHCHWPGHEIGDCFKLHGYPDWWKKLKQQKAKPNTANMVEIDSSASLKGLTENEAKGTNATDMSSIIQQELAKFFSGRMMGGNSNSECNMYFAHLVDYGGPA